MARKSVELIQDQTLYHFDRSNKKNDRSAPKILSLKEQLELEKQEKYKSKPVEKVKEEKTRFGDINRAAYETNRQIIAEKEAAKGKTVKKR